MTSDPRQTVEQLRSEIEFRAKLARQHVTGEVVLPDYLQKEEHDRILLERIAVTRLDMSALLVKDVVVSPFLELGAERGQRSLVLVNEFAAAGVATDISFHQLRAMEHFASQFELPVLPLRVCCDANHLPFRTGAFPFAFCYQFLHHFPTLPPIVAEIRRVVARGHFRFAEEPYRRVLRLALYEQRSSVHAPATRRKNRYRRLLESFISTDRTEEVGHGVLENDDIPLGEWIDAMRPFDAWDAELASTYGIRSSLHRSVRIRNRLNWLLGGTIAGLCRNHGYAPRGGASRPNAEPPARTERAAVDLLGLLACPACVVPGADGQPDRPGLEVVGDGLRCPACAFTYPTRDGVIFLIPPDELRALYPEVLAS